jgi:hypothetical protein
MPPQYAMHDAESHYHRPPVCGSKRVPKRESVCMREDDIPASQPLVQRMNRNDAVTLSRENRVSPKLMTEMFKEAQ